MYKTTPLTCAERDLLDLISNSNNPDEAIETAIDIIQDYLDGKEFKNENTIKPDNG